MKRSELRRRTPPRRRKRLVSNVPLPTRSLRMARLYVQRRKLVAEELETRPWCEMQLVVAGVSICARRSVDLHERLSRGRGGSMLDRENTVAGCRACHTHITENPAEAEALGLSLPTPPRRPRP